MSEFKIHPRDELVPLAMPTGQHHRVVIHHFKVAMVELEDLHFHHDSAVLLPDHDPADGTDAKSGTDLTAFSVLRRNMVEWGHRSGGRRRHDRHLPGHAP